MNDTLDYMRCDPLFRKGKQGELTFSMIYAYSEHFILVLSHDEVVHGKCSLLNKMPGEEKQKFANLRAMYGFMYTHPGKKLLFMGQEFGMKLEWNESTEIQWGLLTEPMHQKLHNYVKDLNHFYLEHKALYELDYDVEGFEWIDTLDSERSIIIFLRKSKEEEETLLVICNFTPVTYKDYQVGVPFAGKFKEIFNSDQVEYGGEGNVNSRLKQSKAKEMHNRENSIFVTVPPMGVSVFSCTPAVKGTKSTTTKRTSGDKSQETVTTKKRAATTTTKKAKASTTRGRKGKATTALPDDGGQTEVAATTVANENNQVKASTSKGNAASTKAKSVKAKTNSGKTSAKSTTRKSTKKS